MTQAEALLFLKAGFLDCYEKKTMTLSTGV